MEVYLSVISKWFSTVVTFAVMSYPIPKDEEEFS
jgi:hypothetical protein